MASGIDELGLSAVYIVNIFYGVSSIFRDIAHGIDIAHLCFNSFCCFSC